MTGQIFIAYPLTTGLQLSRIERFVDMLRDALSSVGFRVLPELSGPERIAQASDAASGRRLLASNVTAVTGCDVLLLLLPPIDEPSSIWVELGMALAAGRSVVIVGPEQSRIPFLARLLVQDWGFPTDARPSATRVLAAMPPELGVDAVVDQILSAVRSVLP